MNTPSLRHWGSTLSFAALMVVVTSHSAWAQDEDSPWRLRFDLSWIDPSGSFVTTGVGGRTFESSIETGFGAGVRGEYRFSSRLGLELGVLSAGSVDIASGFSGGTITNAVEVSSFSPITVGLNIHLTRGRPIDLYVGPQLALVDYSDVEVRTTVGGARARISVDTDVGWGVIVGLDFPLGERGWLIQTNLRYIGTDMKDSGGVISFDNEFDPLILSAGFGYRF